MTIENRYDRLLAYLNDNPSLEEDDKALMQDLLGNLEVDSHRLTAIKVLESGVFPGGRFNHQRGKKGDPSIREFEQFVLKVAQAIDEQSSEIAACLSDGSMVANGKEECFSPDVLAQKFEDHIKNFNLIEDGLRQGKLISPGILDKILFYLEKGKDDLKARLERKRLHTQKKICYPRGKIPHHLIDKLRGILREHAPGLTKLAKSKAIVTILNRFGLELNVNSIRLKPKKSTKSPA